MLTAIDHLVIAVPDPDAAAAGLEATLGLRAAGGGRHEALGTFNRLIWLGDSYVELIGVFDRTRAAATWLGAPTLAALDRGGGLATFALASSSVAEDVAQLRQNGSSLADPIAGERIRPDGRVVRWSLALPPALSADRPPFLIEHDPGAAEWTPAERAERAASVHPLGSAVRLAVLELAFGSVHGAGMTYLQELGLRSRPSLAGGGARDMSVGDQIVRLRPARADRPSTVIRLRAATTRVREADLLGCRWLIEG